MILEKQKLEALKKERDDKVSSVLSEEQKKKKETPGPKLNAKARNQIALLLAKCRVLERAVERPAPRQRKYRRDQHVAKDQPRAIRVSDAREAAQRRMLSSAMMLLVTGSNR